MHVQYEVSICHSSKDMAKIKVDYKQDKINMALVI